jgi:hypothetical protein
MFKIYKSLLAVLLLSLYKISGVVTVVVPMTTNPYLGVSILVKGTTTGTQTDVQGQFQPNGQLQRCAYFLSSASTQEVPLTANQQPEDRLAGSSIQLNEVVVTALNISKDKKSLGYAVQGLKSKDIPRLRKPTWLTQFRKNCRCTGNR